MDKDESTFLRHIPCENCGSSDANSLYSDGHQFCFACNTHVKGDGTCATPHVTTQTKNSSLLSGSYQDLVKRGIREETCRKFGYQIGEWKGQPVQIAPYYDATGTMVAQKVRTADKKFSVLGDISEAQLFGANLWGSGKKIVVGKFKASQNRRDADRVGAIAGLRARLGQNGVQEKLTKLWIDRSLRTSQRPKS